MEKEKEKRKKHTAILGAFLDTLVLNVVPTNEKGVEVSRSFSDDLKDELDRDKALAQHEDDDVATNYSFEWLSLLMTPKGGKGFYWIMHNSRMALAVSRNNKRPLWAQVRLSSEYLWSVRDLGKVLSDVYVFLTQFFGDQHIKLVPSALDMTVDLAYLDWESVQNIKESFITRAQCDADHAAPTEEKDGLLEGPDTVHRRWRKLTGFSFGARAAAVSAMIYDKTHQIKYKEKQKEWFFDLWREVKDENGQPVWDGESAVWRVEMRLRREALNELMCDGIFHGINDAFDLEGLLPGLWAYLVGHTSGGDDGLPDGWLRYVSPSDDTNRSRWPVHPDWKVVQSAFQPVQVPEPFEQEPAVSAQTSLFPELEVLEEPQPFTPASFVPSDPIRFDLLPFVRRRKRKVNTDRMVAQIAGCLVTLEAWRPVFEGDPSPDLSDTMHYAFELIEEYMVRTERDFNDLVENKRPLYSIETAV